GKLAGDARSRRVAGRLWPRYAASQGGVRRLGVPDPAARSGCPGRRPAAVTFVPYDRPVRAAFIGLGRIYDLNVRGYLGNPDVEVVALVDPSAERRAQRQADWPEAATFASAAELASSGLDVDPAEVLLRG